MPGEEDSDKLAVTLAEMARDLLAQASVQSTLDRIAYHATRVIEGCDDASILVVRGDEYESVAATSRLARDSNTIQGELREGPCFDAARDEEEVYRIADLNATAHRWPRYTPRARELGIGSMMGFMLFTGEENLGALDLYSRRPSAFTGNSEQVGWVLASHAAVGLANARRDAQLRDAIATRQDIGEAMGIVMERHKVSEDEAFGILRKSSQVRNVKLREVARLINKTGEIPGAR
ncbi:GAF and ANTAR domain-containing protein [Qaidamihabitans albus]|uniref:GAF and ANTAR domain-containing protein n=1 Tax=Qaidamihabitans albus TaxID=2795733 RepID=UPI0018F14AD6|nr:GAF and ANTAR domain-containing protein [Qaidamihabitans albus]